MDPVKFAEETVRSANSGVRDMGSGRVSLPVNGLEVMEEAYRKAESMGKDFLERYKKGIETCTV